MKIVDFTLRAQQARSDSDAGAGASGDSEDKPLKSLVEKFQEQFKLARMRREEAVKLKDIKSLAFGKYSIQVPSFNLGTHAQFCYIDIVPPWLLLSLSFICLFNSPALRPASPSIVC